MESLRDFDARISELLAANTAEVERAEAKHKPMNSAHEGLSVIWEEYLGHGDDPITQRVYGRFSPEHLLRAAATIGW